MLPCKVSCFHTLPLYRATTSLRKLRAAKAVVSYANYNWPGTSSLWNKTHTDVPQYLKKRRLRLMHSEKRIDATPPQMKN